MNKKIYNNLNIENLTKTEWFNQFDKEQQEEIIKGLENELDVSIYAKECFNVSQISFLNFVLGNNCSLKDKEKILIFAKPEFDHDQMKEIYLGLQANIDATIYGLIKW